MLCHMPNTESGSEGSRPGNVPGPSLEGAVPTSAAQASAAQAGASPAGAAPLKPLEPKFDSPASLRALLDAEGLAMSKRFGQNFLVNPTSRARILEELRKVLPARPSGPKAAAGAPASAAASVPAAAAGPGPGAAPAEREAAAIWEIGPGIGSMTAMALDTGLEVTAFEIDRGFARLLGRIFAGRPNFRLVEGDFLRTWKAELAAGRLPDAVFGNLPYNVASAMVALLIERYPEAAGSGGPPPMVFTVQKEAALRMAARPGTKDYSAFSVLCASACRVRIAFDLAGGSFWPVPNVQSSLVVLEPRPDPISPADRLGFSAFVRSAFSSRRKTLKNNLKAAGRPEAEVAAALEALGHSPSVRAEALRPEELAAVYGRLKAAPVPPLPTGGPGPYDAEL